MADRNAYKWIKGNLTIKALWGYSENAVKTQLWVAISSYLLLAWMKAALKKPCTLVAAVAVLPDYYSPGDRSHYLGLRLALSEL